MIIPVDRRIDWQGNVGIPGGIPNRTSIYATLSPSGGDDTSAIQTALTNCPYDQVVKLTAGTFLVSGQLTISHHVVIRGAGATSTIVKGSGSGSIFYFNGPFWGYGDINIAQPIASGFTKGSTAIVLTNTLPADIAVGTTIQITEPNDTAVVDTGANQIDFAIGQWVSVTALNAGTKTISIDPPLYRSYNAAQAPRLRYHFNGAIPSLNNTEYAGIEDLTIDNDNTGYHFNVIFERAAYCWLKGVVSKEGSTAHIWFLDSFRCEIRKSKLDSIIGDITSSRGYGILFGTPNPPHPCSKGTAHLIEDNIFYQTRGAIMFGYGASGNVVSYNYFLLPYDTQSPTIMKMDVSVHSSHAMFNLVEGNIGAKFDADFEHGGASDQTVHRNWWRGRSGNAAHVSSLSSVNIAARQMRYNVVGNVLGFSGLSTEIAALGSPGTSVYAEAYPGSATYGNSWKAYMLGYMGEGGGTTTHNTVAELDPIRLLNASYDSTNGGAIPATEATAEALLDSYYTTKAQAEARGMVWGALTFPPVDPASPGSLSSDSIPAGYRYNHSGSDPEGGGGILTCATLTAVTLTIG